MTCTSGRAIAIGVSVDAAKVAEKDAIRVRTSPAINEVDDPTFGKLKGTSFKDGTIDQSIPRVALSRFETK